MKRLAVILLLVLAFASPVYALNPVDAVLCKRVVLRAIDRTVLVNRLTGTVKYILCNGQWIILTGERQRECQAMYNAQVYIRKHTGQ